MMSPLQIRMVLHYYAICEPYAKNDPLHANSPAVAEEREWLVEAGILTPSDERNSGWITTDRGNAYVEALCSVPFPVQHWVMPSTRDMGSCNG